MNIRYYFTSSYSFETVSCVCLVSWTQKAARRLGVWCYGDFSGRNDSCKVQITFSVSWRVFRSSLRQMFSVAKCDGLLGLFQLKLELSFAWDTWMLSHANLNVTDWMSIHNDVSKGSCSRHLQSHHWQNVK